MARPVFGLAAAALATALLLPGPGRAEDTRFLVSHAGVLLDGTGQVVGQAFPLAVEVLDPVYVWARIGGHDVLLQASPGQLVPVRMGRLGFLNPDCTGDPWFLPDSDITYVFDQVAFGSLSTLFVPDGPAELTEVHGALDPGATLPASRRRSRASPCCSERSRSWISRSSRPPTRSGSAPATGHRSTSPPAARTTAVDQRSCGPARQAYAAAMGGRRCAPWTGLLLAGTVGLSLAATSAAAQTAGRRLPPSPVAVDASGQVIGAVAALGVQVKVGDRVAIVTIARDQFTGGGGSAVFESVDCSGTAFLLPSVSTPLPMLERVAVGPLSVLLAPAGPLESRTIRSRWIPGEVPAFCQPLPATASDVQPTERLLDLGVFTPPFRIE